MLIKKMSEKSTHAKSAFVFVCGDVLNKSNNNGMLCSQPLSDLITSANYSVCNFEASVEGYGAPAIKPGKLLNQKAQTISGLKKQGFDLLLLANNHIMDYGENALAATLKIAKENKLDTLGAGLDAQSAYRPIMKRINGLTVGMINAGEAQHGELYSDKENIAGHAWISHPAIERTIIDLRKACDFVIVFAHAGLEHFPIPQKEWRVKYKHFCDLGADVVVGAHPHVPQGYEKYNQSVVFYSLGNFYFDTKKYQNKENPSFAVLLELNKDKQVSFQLIHHYTKQGKVQLAPEAKRTNVGCLNSLLGEGYLSQHEKMTLTAYNKIKKALAVSVFLPVPLSGRAKV